jgi:hypothetical protein
LPEESPALLHCSSLQLCSPVHVRDITFHGFYVPSAPVVPVGWLLSGLKSITVLSIQ